MLLRYLYKFIFTIIATLFSSISLADDGHNHGLNDKSTEVKLYQSLTVGNGVGKFIGAILIEESKDGLIFITDLRSLPIGKLKVTINRFPNCGYKEKEGNLVASLGAGGKFLSLFDLDVVEDGTSMEEFIIPNIFTLFKVEKRSLVISNEEGVRVACGLIK